MNKYVKFWSIIFTIMAFTVIFSGCATFQKQAYRGHMCELPKNMHSIKCMRYKHKKMIKKMIADGRCVQRTTKRTSGDRIITQTLTQCR